MVCDYRQNGPRPCKENRQVHHEDTLMCSLEHFQAPTVCSRWNSTGNRDSGSSLSCYYAPHSNENVLCVKERWEAKRPKGVRGREIPSQMTQQKPLDLQLYISY